ncbi:Hpt domain-containing protein [Rhodalgimonas zhirmunskyi]|uniref:Hpt domain-containing protein n=1 Tax=Rhodalgimonas zhirmunskyi TaxID=2964767 RepID=A0AAJ1U9F2_9RHOB|nr:Hpt domain-containing protein [Rhodoalgimonas zhirmunskyi]MDQ2094230.1 Hpt domain-containing protein [Rhodoalgimonas zhirmunskyi]
MIDWGKVSELNQEIGPEDFAEVVELFLEEVDATIAEIAAGMPEERLEETLHFLKGSALNLGFSEFAGLCAKYEQSAHRGAFDKIDLGRVSESYVASKERFLAEWPSRIAA